MQNLNQKIQKTFYIPITTKIKSIEGDKMATTEAIALYVILGAIIGIIWSLRKIYVLENNIAALDLKIEKVLEHLSKKKK